MEPMDVDSPVPEPSVEPMDVDVPENDEEQKTLFTIQVLTQVNNRLEHVFIRYFNPFATECLKPFHSHHLVCDSVRFFMISTSPRAVTRKTRSFAEYRAGKILAISVFKTSHDRLVMFSAKTLQASVITLSSRGGSGETGLFLHACCL